MVAVARENRRAMARPLRAPDDSTYLGRIAVRMKALRIAAGLEHEAAAKAISDAGWPVSVSSIYRWEQGRGVPHYAALPAIAEAYGVDSPRTVLPRE